MRATTLTLILAVLMMALPATAQPRTPDETPVEQWVDATGRAAGTDEKAREEAVAQALRTAVEEACGVFLTAQSESRDYKTVYDKVLADAVGYVREYKVLSTQTVGEVTVAKVRALVSTRKFEQDWAAIAHTVERENNPRVIVAIVESTTQSTSDEPVEVQENGILQGKIEDFFLGKGITLMDKTTATEVTKRDVLLAAIKDDINEVSALGARFDADVIVTGRATAKFSRQLEVAGQNLYQYTATLNARVIQTDSARVLVSKNFGPVSVNVLQRGGGDDKALEKLGDSCASELLSAVVEAWRKRAQVSRTVQVSISGLDFEAWKLFREKTQELRGVQAVRLREITESVANIDIEYRYTNETLAERLTELEGMKLKVLEITANRLKMQYTPATAEQSAGTAGNPTN